MLGFIVSALCAVWLIPPSQMATGIVPAPHGRGSISGRVVDEANAPVPDVTVALSRYASQQVSTSAHTDREGRFSFPDLGPGLYALTASKSAYVTTDYGRRAGALGTPVELNAGESIRELVVRIERGGAVAGRVLRPDGSAFGNLAVEVLQRRISKSALPSWTVIGSTLSDDRGQYRVTGLASGDYLVRAHPPAGSLISPGLPSAGTEAVPHFSGYVSTYYPGTAREEEANAVALTADFSAEHLDIVVHVSPFARIDGRVSTSTGPAALSMGDVFLQRTDAAGDPPIVASTNGERFRFAAVSPGEYVLLARFAAKKDVTGQMVAASALSLTGIEATSIDLVLHAPPAVGGSVIVDGGSLPARTLAIALVPVNPALKRMASKPERVTTDGTFSAAGSVPGRYRINVAPESAVGPNGGRWLVTSVTRNGRRLDDNTIDLPEGGAVEDVAVSVTDRLGTISGNVSDQAGTPRPEYTVILFPQNAALWPALGSRIFAGRPTDNGHFRFEDVLPGEYHVAAVKDPEPNQWLLRSFLETLVPTSTRLVVQPDAHMTVRLVVGGRH